MTRKVTKKEVPYSELMERELLRLLASQRTYINALGEQKPAPEGLDFNALTAGTYFGTDGKQLSVEDFQWLLIGARPHLFANTFLREPDTREPYEFWPYQLPSVNYRRGDVIHKDGAEVGKTREIITLLLWSCYTLHNLELLDPRGRPVRRVHSLVGAPLTGNLKDIIDAIDEQFDLDESGHLKMMCGKAWHEKAPYHKMKFGHADGTAIIDFRPAGISGAAFRGIHANAFGLKEEAALEKNPKQWSEYKRALKPTATERDYSVPDGDRNSAFYHRAASSLPWDEFRLRYPQGFTGPGKPPRVLFTWDKTMMPPPFWSDDRRREYIRDFGGEDSPGYQQNVLGKDGDPADSVFPWGTMGPCVVDIHEYRCLKVLVNKEENEATFELYRFEPVAGAKDGEELLLWERTESISDWRDEETCRSSIEQLVFEAFGQLPTGIPWAGADLGQTRDPTEITVALERGTTMRRVVRISLRGVEYIHQAEFLRAVDIVADPDAERPMWGVDEGNAGTAVIGILNQSRFDDQFDDRILGVQFGSAFEAVDLDGEPIMVKGSDGEEKQLRQNGKELGTDLIVMGMQKHRAQYPLDPEVISHYSSHTATQGQRWRIYSKKNDHTIDADRVMMINKVLASEGGGDSFACGASKR